MSFTKEESRELKKILLKGVITAISGGGTSFVITTICKNLLSGNEFTVKEALAVKIGLASISGVVGCAVGEKFAENTVDPVYELIDLGSEVASNVKASLKAKTDENGEEEETDGEPEEARSAFVRADLEDLEGEEGAEA